MKAIRLFQDISRGLGIEVARQIFVAIATPSTQRKREEWSRCFLLTLYILCRRQYDWPLKTVASFFAKINKEEGWTIGVRNHTEGAIYEELRNLLGKRPPKNPSPILRDLIEEAKKLPERRPGRPKGTTKSAFDKKLAEGKAGLD